MRIARCIKVRNMYGICSQPAALIVHLVARRAGGHEVVMEKDGVRTSARNILGLLTLEGQQDTEIVTTVDGPEADRVVREIEALFDDKFGQE